MPRWASEISTGAARAKRHSLGLDREQGLASAVITNAFIASAHRVVRPIWVRRALFRRVFLLKRTELGQPSHHVGAPVHLELAINAAQGLLTVSRAS